MGDYTVVIEGTGAHDNNPPNEADANMLALEFADRLEAMGHKVHAVVITTGKRDVLVLPRQSLTGDKIDSI